MDLNILGKKPDKPAQARGAGGPGAAPKKAGLFGGKPKEPGIDVAGINTQLNNLSMRMRILEERYANLRKKTQVIEQNMLSSTKKVRDEIKLVDSDVSEIKRQISELNGKTNQIILELRNCAMKNDLDVIKKYVEMWQPINFVTLDQAERMIQEAIGEKK